MKVCDKILCLIEDDVVDIAWCRVVYATIMEKQLGFCPMRCCCLCWLRMIHKEFCGEWVSGSSPFVGTSCLFDGVPGIWLHDNLRGRCKWHIFHLNCTDSTQSWINTLNIGEESFSSSYFCIEDEYDVPCHICVRLSLDRWVSTRCIYFYTGKHLITGPKFPGKCKTCMTNFESVLRYHWLSHNVNYS